MTAFPRLNEPPLENRGRVIKLALTYMPFAVGSTILVLLALYQLLAGETGFIVMLVVFGTVAGLTGSQFIMYVWDLTARPVQYEGSIVKKWHKGNFLFFLLPSYYIAIDTRIHSGRVNRVTDSGAFVTTEDGSEGFVPRKELSDEPARSANEMVHAGEEIRYKVVGVDRRGNYRLSCRKADEYTVVTKLFSVTQVEYALLLEKDTIKVTCYPHSTTVERIERYDDFQKRFVPAVDGADG